MKSKNKSDLYTSALNHMIHGEYKTAIKQLKDIIRHDTDNIDAYVKLGVLFRETNDAESAIKVHQGLLYRADLPKNQRIMVLRHLLEDYEASGEKEKALDVAEKILDINRRNQWAYDKMHRLYRDLKNWPKAAEYLEKSIRFGKKKSYARLIALYKVQEGFEKYRGGDYHEARLLFRKAAKIDPKCEAAYYYIANSYVKDQRQEDAIPWWEKFAEVAPAKASLVFPYLQKVLFNMGNFNQIESFYQDILRKRPEDIQAHLALASFYDRKGDRKRALEICEEMKDKNPDSALAKITLAKYLLWNNQIQKSSEILDEVIDRLQNSHSYTCSRCGAVVDEVRWLCPICGEPDTFLSVI